MPSSLPNPPLSIVERVLSFERKELFEIIHDAFPRDCESFDDENDRRKVGMECSWTQRNRDSNERLEWLEKKLRGLRSADLGGERDKEKAWFEHTETMTPTIEYVEFLKSWYWRWIRSIIIPDRSSRCENCFKTDLGRCLQLHHIEYEFRGLERLHPENIVVLCDRCHGRIHGVT